MELGSSIKETLQRQPLQLLMLAAGQCDALGLCSPRGCGALGPMGREAWEGFNLLVNLRKHPSHSLVGTIDVDALYALQRPPPNKLAVPPSPLPVAEVLDGLHIHV